MIEKMVQTLKNYFIPHPGNDHKPHILRPRAVAFVFIVMVVAESAFVLGSTYIVPRLKLFGLIEANALVDETNQQRVADGLEALEISPLLTQAAQDKANDMATNNYFAHTSPAGVTPWDWFEKAGYSFSFAGENLAVNFANSQDVTNAWMNSPDHRANILDGAFTQIGIATAQGTYNGQPAIYVVEEFGTPAAAPLAFVNTAAAASVANPAPATSKPAAAVPSAPKAVAVVVASTSVGNSSSQQLFVAVKGAETQTAPTTAAATVATTSVVVTTPVGVATAAAAPGAPKRNGFESALQWLVSNPRAVTNDFYIFLIALFAVASVLNFFVNIRVQFPRLILAGMTVIVLAGLCVLLNQSIGLFHAVII